MELNSAGYIYLLADKVNNTYKIGRTKNLEQRIRSIKTGNPNQIDLIAYAICNNTVVSEKRIHNLYSYKRRRGKEWFDLSEQEVTDLKILLAKITVDDKHERNIDRFVMV